MLKTFYIFKLNKEYNNIAKKNPESIYTLLYSIYQHKKDDVLVAFNLFSDICLPINIDFFDKYIYQELKSSDEYTKYRFIHMYNDYLNDETSKMEIFKSFIRVKSNKVDNIFNESLIKFNNIFICEFGKEYIYNTKSIKTKV